MRVAQNSGLFLPFVVKTSYRQGDFRLFVIIGTRRDKCICLALLTPGFFQNSPASAAIEQEESLPRCGRRRDGPNCLHLIADSSNAIFSSLEASKSLFRSTIKVAFMGGQGSSRFMLGG